MTTSGRGAATRFDDAWQRIRGLPDAASGYPEYDNIFFAHKENSFTAAKKRLIYTKSALMRGSLLMDGQVVAAWHREAGSDDLTLLPWADELPDEAVAAVRGTSGVLRLRQHPLTAGVPAIAKLTLTPSQ